MKIIYEGDLGGGVVLEDGTFCPHGKEVEVKDGIAEKLLKERSKDFKRPKEFKMKKGGGK